MVRKDEGIVLKAARSGETSRRVTFLGRESGKVQLIGKGAMSSRSPFRGALEPGNRLQIVYYHKEGRTLFFLKEVHVVDTLRSGAGSLEQVAAGLAALELLDQVCYPGSPEAHIVDLVESYLACHRAVDPLAVYLALELKLLDVLGTAPHIAACSECGDAGGDGYYYPAEGSSRCRQHAFAEPHRVRLDRELIRIAEDMSLTTFDELVGRALDPGPRKRLGKLLHWTYTFHVQGYRLPESLKLITKTRHH